MMDISTTADRAADILETQGHIKFDWGRCDGPRCLGGAISQAASEIESTVPCHLYGSTIDAVTDFLDLKRGNDFIDWNNAPERKPEEVIQVLRDVATKHRDDAMTVEAGK